MLITEVFQFGGFYELCDHFKNYYRIFTDGSKEGVEDKQLSWWLKQTTNFTAPTVQNEMLEMLSQEIVDTVRNESVQFAVVVDGTTDYSGVEQESVWLRYTDKEMKLHESFIGLYEPAETTGECIAEMIVDVLTKMHLPVANLRAQTYDGAANMAGAYKGCQALISQQQPLAIFFHCSAHCANLVAEYTASCSPLIRDALQVIQELTTLSTRSSKLKRLFREFHSDHNEKAAQTLKPLCPTRWLTACHLCGLFGINMMPFLLYWTVWLLSKEILAQNVVVYSHS